MFKMEGKQMFLTNKVFYLCSLAVELIDSVHPSVDVYVAKNLSCGLRMFRLSNL